MKILFVLKNRTYNKEYATSFGLMNSALQVSKYLNHKGHESKVVSVIDYNFIDREVHSYKPDIVIIEALWVSSKKMKELIELKRYKNINWVVRIHSDIGFLSAETNALTYVNEYVSLKKDNLFVSINNKEFCKNLSDIYGENFIYLPNIIDIHNEHKKHRDNYLTVNIGCFGALRLLKNQLFQAMCAMKFADSINKTLFYHINCNVNPDKENSILKNLTALFDKNASGHKLVVHNWLDNEDFHQLVRSMDLGLQLSYTESFNITAADFVMNDTPIIVSEALSWLPWFNKTSTTNYKNVLNKLKWIYRFRNSKLMAFLNKRNLKKYNKEAKEVWKDYIKYIEYNKIKSSDV